MEIFKSLDSLPIECVMAMREAIEDSLMSGSLIGYPIVNTRVRIIDGRWSNIRSRNPLIFKQAASQLMKQLLKES
jgi:translation elongation factor EF-G